MLIQQIFKKYLNGLARSDPNALEEFRVGLVGYLKGDPSTVPNKIHLKFVAAQFFYGKNYQRVVDAIDRL